MDRTKIAELYRNAIRKVFNPHGDEYIDRAIAHDVHPGDTAPGQWGNGRAILEIYCENGIPNATDIFDPRDYGFEGKPVYNSELWDRVDQLVQTKLDGVGDILVYAEPVNGAVICVWPL
jgi:hypothetical protein